MQSISAINADTVTGENVNIADKTRLTVYKYFKEQDR